MIFLIKKNFLDFFLIILSLIGGLAFSINNPHKFPVDDGYFYLQIAKNIVLYGESTFHTILNTNGYHPLWLIICVVITFLSPDDPDNLLRITFLVQSIIFTVASCFIIKLSHKCNINPFISIGVLLIIFIGKGSLFLMESFLALLFLIICLHRFLLHLEKTNKTDNKFFFFTSLICAILVLSRLDLIFFVAIYIIILSFFVIKWNGLRNSINTIFHLLFPLCLIILTYMLFNYYFFNILFPISGLVKSYKLFTFSVERLGILGVILSALSILFFITIYFRKLFINIYDSDIKNTELILLLLVTSSFIYSLYICLYIDAAPWYFLINYVLIAIFTSYVCKVIQIKTLSSKLDKVVIISTLIICLSFSFLRANTNYSIFSKFIYKDTLSTQFQRTSSRLNLAFEMKKTLKANTSVLVFDTPGILAFYTKLNIFPSDGLMNNYYYNKDLLNEGALNYFCSRNVNYVLAPLPSKEQKIFDGLHLSVKKNLLQYELTISSPIYKIASTPIILEGHNLVKKFENPLNKKIRNFPYLGLWKFSCFK